MSAHQATVIEVVVAIGKCSAMVHSRYSVHSVLVRMACSSALDNRAVAFGKLAEQSMAVERH